ncbi:Glyoxalase/bleomycin resistance protein/dioxygenase [Ancylobacter novellus DSM 506]|uniref:Glyoxalase/bleomycin resistance protein/dioxygenase n=1 Tax=Ancylobacter novellus (strain ATCC 8093 / DSM 506 / JCM 20403 / CCM 1077 / IAM 12100 / NBRC 12443 / NCIMB 10456) TaxID=639283 RepID=D7A719_ANCN5|nr:VOC family protein [Ancylobacter novellus]ADH88393.1 Glyoxalase/bleomycin resistance protein/dioxygenase [Ancylobacter novellus DSM 506]
MVELHEWHRGRLIDHIQLVVRDFDACRRFYGAVLEVIGVPIIDCDGFFFADELCVFPGEPLTGRAHIAFQAPDEETVQRFYAAALRAGGRDNGAPGLRDYHPGYYAAFVLDPEGNNIEAVFHGPAKRSAPSVVMTDAS